MSISSTTSSFVITPQDNDLPLEHHACIGRAHVPGGEELRLLQNGDEFTIVLRDNELMSSRANASEAALATMTYARLGNRTAQQWLIGGYGMGFTLRAALGALGSDACVTVVEIVPEVMEWAHGPMKCLTANCLDDTRVVLVNEDVTVLIDAACAGYDAILLDVDNGPEGLTRRSNDDLYSGLGLAAAHSALKPGGILAVWSAGTDDDFRERLKFAGFETDQVSVNDGLHVDGDTHILWFARKRCIEMQ